MEGSSAAGRQQHGAFLEVNISHDQNGQRVCLQVSLQKSSLRRVVILNMVQRDRMVLIPGLIERNANCHCYDGI
jgi:hypothetical protein